MPDKLRAQLLTLLANLEKEVEQAKRLSDHERELQALAEVMDVRIALGMAEETTKKAGGNTSTVRRIKSTIFSFLRHRDVESSICPSEVARVVAPSDAWRDIMPDVRSVAVELAAADVLIISRGKEMLDPRNLGKGPIRLRRGASF